MNPPTPPQPLAALEAEYREAAEDTAAEQEAMDWIEAHVDEALD